MKKIRKTKGLGIGGVIQYVYIWGSNNEYGVSCVRKIVSH